MASEILTYPNPLLRKQIKFDDSLSYVEIFAKLIEVAEEFDLLGLAANQIGIETRALLFRTERGLHPLMDPKIEAVSDVTWDAPEGCASLPGFGCFVRRPYQVKVSCTNLGTKVFLGWTGRIIQHEIDHLDGYLIFDKEVREPA